MSRIENFSEFRRLRRLALKAGWTIELTSKGHVRFTPPDPDAEPVVMSGSPREGSHVLRHYKPRLRAAGLKGA
jgi:hypothetical protein